MFFQTTIKLSIKNLLAQKMRSFLTMLGIIIGISSIIMITSVVSGAQSLITNQFSSLGSNVIGVLPGGSDDDGPPAAVMGIVITSLKDEDTEALKNIPHVVSACSYVSSTETVSWDNQKITASLYGVSPDYPNISDSKLKAGSFFDDQDNKGLANVAIIGSQVEEDLFENTDAIGQKIQVRNTKFNIIGIMEPQGTSGFQNVDNMVFVPVSTAQKRVLGINHLGFLRIKVDKDENLNFVLEEVKQVLRQRHNIDNPNEDDFTARSTADALQALGQITSALQFFLIAIVSISLLVGGIGIMNIMLAAVTERIREIGLRKAVGAKRIQIIYQFLTETIFITFIGALIGIVIGSIIAFLISIVVNKLGYDWTFSITLFSIMLSCGFAFFVGIVFGLYPAIKASKLDSITALRYE